MDDFHVSSLHESKNEWGSRLLTILTPHIMDGLKSIFDEAVKLCKENNEMDKYLMTFQNFITRIPKWNPVIIEKERARIVEKSTCQYLEDLVTCVHIIQLKILTAIRVGQKQKKIDISIPKLDDFIHKVYIYVARKVYKNVYLFELNIPPLQVQKNYRELEIIIQECILNAIRDSIPVEAILRAYMDETIEEDVVEEIKEQVVEPVEEPKSDKHKQAETHIVKEIEDAGSASSKKIEDPQPKQLETEFLEPIQVETETGLLEFPTLSQEEEDKSSVSSYGSKLTFDNVDYAIDINNREEKIEAPKDISRLEEISEIRNAQRKIEEMNDDEDDHVPKLNIMYENATLDNLDIHVIDNQDLNLNTDLLLDDIEVLA